MNDHGNHRTPIDQATRTPVLEPPEVDLIGIVERPEWQEFLRDVEKRIPNPVIRDEFMNKRGERLALECLWAFDARRAASHSGNVEKEVFYEDRVNTSRKAFDAALDNYLLARAFGNPVQSPLKNPLAVRNASEEEIDGDQGEQPISRQITMDSQAEFEQSQQLFDDFDGQHINESPPVEQVVEISPQLRPQLGKRRSTATLLSPTEAKFERPKSYADPLTGQEMVFYPAPVPSMLQLPPKLSQRPNAQARAKRHTQILASASGARPAHGRSKSAVWLPDIVDGTDDDRRKSFMDVGLSGASQPSGGSVPERPKDARRNTTQPMLPEHLRANEYFEQMAPVQVVEIKEQSAAKTLDDILDASAHAPVSAFTDHAIAGRLGAEIYGHDYPKSRTKSQIFSSGSGVLDPEGKDKENKKPALVKRASSFFGLINKSDDALGGERKSTLSILGRGKSPVYDVVGERSPTFQRDDARDQESEDDEVQGGEPREMDTRYEEDLYSGAPTTLLAELQLRKQQAKQRTQPTALPAGYRTTLLEMDAVAQTTEDRRKSKRVTLAWQDQSVVQQEREQESEDEDVPLGVLFPEQARRQQDNAVRPMGLLERREIEDNEPLSKRRERLLARQPLTRPPVVKRASTLNFGGNNPSVSHVNSWVAAMAEQARRQQDNGVRPVGLMDGRELDDDEPLSKRRERLLGLR